MLAHELAHLDRRDGLWLLLARVIETVFVIQPLNRLARRRMVEAAEFAADRWAVNVTGKPVTLATCLARVAEWSLEDLRFAPAMAPRRSSTLVRRVRELTGRAPVREESRVTLTLCACALVAVGSLMPRVAIGGAGNVMRADTQRTIIVRRGLPGTRLMTKTFDREIVIQERK